MEHPPNLPSAFVERFQRFERLVQRQGLERLYNAHVIVIGVGGVGSFAAESLARSGVGRLTLVDSDQVSVSNLNRQLQATTLTLGQTKAMALTERLQSINPQARIEAQVMRFSTTTAEPLLSLRPDAIVDAIDSMAQKCELLSECRERSLFVLTSLGAADKLDPTQVRVADLSQAKQCPMGRALRKRLRQKFGFPRHGSFQIPAVFSLEEPYGSRRLLLDPETPAPPNQAEALESEKAWAIHGSASFVTGTFGLFCAATVIHHLLSTKV